MGITERINKIYEETEAIKNEISAMIAAFPDNPDINRINQNCFTLNSVHVLKDNMIISPRYYDWKYQHRKIIEKLRRQSINTIYSTFVSMIKDGSFKLDDEKIQLHPEVIKQLQSIIDTL